MSRGNFSAAPGTLGFATQRAPRRRNCGPRPAAGRARRGRSLRFERLDERALLSAAGLAVSDPAVLAAPPAGAQDLRTPALEFDHPWNPQPAKASLLLVSAHPDDEGLFFGGTIPYYAAVANTPLVHIAMTSGWTDGGPWETRLGELMDADWAYGLRNPPIVPMGPEHPLFADVYADGPMGRDTTFDVWNDGDFDNFADVAAGRAKAAAYLASQIRVYRPDVILTHDFDGEYGHGNHKATAFATADAFTLAADPGYVDGNAPWQAQKLYTHLENRPPSEPILNKLWMDWSVPYAELGGKTPLEAANEGLAMHVSQGGSNLVWIWADWRFPEQYGLYASTVGPDTVSGDGWAHTDFFENVVTPSAAPVLGGIEAAPRTCVAYGPAVAITASLTVADADSPNLSGATVAIVGNYVPGEDWLAFTNQNGITGSFSAGVLTLGGSSSPANYETALRSVTYSSTSNGPGTLARTVRFQVSDGVNDSNAVTREVTVHTNRVTSFDVQRGAVQRSYVRYLDLLFSQESGLDGLLAGGRVSLTRFDFNGTGGVAVNLAGLLSVSGNGLTFDFGVQGIGGNRSSAAGDGYYAVGLDLDGDGGFETVRHFYRMVGDLSGDRHVNLADFGLLKLHYGATSAAGDINGDGIVNLQDFGLLKLGYGNVLLAGLPLDD